MTLSCFDCGHTWTARGYQDCPACGSVEVQERELAEALR